MRKNFIFEIPYSVYCGLDKSIHDLIQSFRLCNDYRHEEYQIVFICLDLCVILNDTNKTYRLDK